MENLNQDPTSTYETKPIKKQLVHHPSKTYKNIYRSSHYKSHKYADIGFTITKLNKKYVAHCRVCNRTLGNTAYARLKGHRNICRGASWENSGLELECQSYPVSNNEILVPNQSDSHSQQCVSQTSNDSPILPFNEMTPKIEQVESELTGNLPPYCNSDQESQLLNEENNLKLNMIEVLLPIKYNQNLLFKDNTKKSIDMWMEVLKKAQALGLAPPGVPWTYARDSLYLSWRHHTLQKKNAIESGELNVKYNIVDITILQIEDASIPSHNSNFENENFYETADNSIFDKTTEDMHLSKQNCPAENENSISTQTSDEMYKLDLRLKLLQCEAMEIENYKRCLEALELERKLQIPHSNFAAKYFPSTTQIRSNNVKSNGRRWEDTNNIVKIEIDG